jgi:hypothetical protein
MVNSLEELRKDRLDWIKTTKKNNFDVGINRLLTELYPENAHFIYELLQNAEDPQATAVQFNLTNSAVEFAHNGKRLFTFKDVESITSIGNSTKRDDATSIGKFGVGFKAVFAYTNTPEIHSGDFHFRIRDLVAPETEGVEQSTTDKEQTCFIFPFDNPKKSAGIAVQQIEKGLCVLGDNTLLFLSHISKIDYALPDGSTGSLERITLDNGLIEIRTSHPNNEATVSHWLHFYKDVDVTDDDGKSKTCRIAIAYQLEQVTGKNNDSLTWKIIAVQGGGQVSIYFPAEKETSKLRFHIHAPFASTVARDSVRDCPANKQLRDYLAELIAESLTAIRDQGMLSMSFLAVLPIPKDDLSSFYEPIREAIVVVFINERLTPTKSGKYAASGALYRGSSKISDVISDKDLSILTGYKIPLRVANAPQRNQREDNFLDSLKIDEWGFEQLSDIFEPIEKEKTESWLVTKDDKWMMRFYVLLNDDSTYYFTAEDFPLVRVDSKKGVKHVTGSQAYFSPLHGNVSAHGVHIVKRAVYTRDNTKHDVDENAEKFLKRIGVKPFDTKAVIDLRLQFYRLSPPKQITDEYYEDIKQFISYWKENAKEGSWYRRETDELFKPVKFLLDANTYWQKAIDICLDSPVIETGTGLAELTEIHGKNPISSEYSKKLNEDERKDFVEFLKALGVMFKLEVVELDRHEAIQNPNNPYKTSHWTCADFARDYSIPELGKYLTAKKHSASLIIWNAIINASKVHTFAEFQLKKRGALKSVDSRLVYLLKKYAWIPNKSGEFKTPQAMTRETLHPDFPFNDSNNLLTAIEFGKEEKDCAEKLRLKEMQASTAYQTKANIAKNNGFDSPEEMAEAASFLQELKKQGMSLTDIQADMTKNSNIELPEESVPNPERRLKGVLERSEKAPSKESVMRERSIQPGIANVVAEAKAYLRAKYTNPHGEMVCQCCQHEMPFKIVDSYYFEAVQCIKRVENHHIENRLALCPTCAAMYQHARETDDTEISRLIIEHEAPDNALSVEIPVTLAGKQLNLRFVGIHRFDLKTVLENSN